MRRGSIAIGMLSLATLVAGCRTEPDRSAPAASTPAPPPPPARARVASTEPPGRGLVEENCLGCHVQSLLATQRLTEAQWAKVIEKMRTWGSAIEPWHAATLASHLAALYGPGQPPARLVRVPASQKEARVSALPDGPFGGGDPKLGRAVFAAQCATCHGADGRGGRLGTNLARRPLLYRTREFARWVREGRGRMPAFVLATDREIAAVLAHLRARR